MGRRIRLRQAAKVQATMWVRQKRMTHRRDRLSSCMLLLVDTLLVSGKFLPVRFSQFLKDEGCEWYTMRPEIPYKAATLLFTEFNYLLIYNILCYYFIYIKINYNF